MTHSAALNYKAIVRILGTILFIIGISMIIPWLYAEFAKEPESARAFRICAPITAVFGPVSYTHLDVYKRQPYIGSLKIFLLSWPLTEIPQSPVFFLLRP